MMNEREKSDPATVAAKFTNEAGRKSRTETTLMKTFYLLY